MKYFYIILFLFIPLFVFSQSSSEYNIELNNGNVLTFPYQIKFSEGEIKLIKSLDSTTLQKLVEISKQLKQKNVIQSTQASSTQTIYSSTYSEQTPYYNPQTRQYQSTPVSPSQSTQALQQPTAYSMQPSARTPYYNPQTGMYQSTPALNGSQTGNPFLDTANKAIKSITDQSAPPGGTVDISNLDILEICKKNYGVALGGSCPNIENATELLKKTTMLACSAIKKPIPSDSVVRDAACTKKLGQSGASEHTRGKAIDISQRGLTSVEKQKIYEVFKKQGFNGYGCYGPNGHVHLDHGTPRRWGKDGRSASFSASQCPRELGLAGYNLN